MACALITPASANPSDYVQPVQVNPATSPSSVSAVQDISGQSSWFNNLIGDRPFPVRFELFVSETYDDNIYISPQKSSDFITQVALNSTYQIGDKTAIDGNFFSIAFKPTAYIYADHSQQDAEDYFADLTYQHRWTKLTLGLEQRFEKLTNTTIDVGNFVNREVYTTVLNADYDYSDRVSLMGTLTQRITDFDNHAYANTDEWIADGYALYQIAPKLGLGFGPRFGYVSISHAPGQTYEDALLHAQYNVTQKITANLAAGAEFRQYDTSSVGDEVLPIFEASLSYKPFDGTVVTLSSYRHSLTSYNQVGQNYVDTQVQANLKQRFLRKFYYLLSAGYDNSEYKATSSNTANSHRKDDYFFVNTGVEWDPNDWLTVSTRYQYSEDNSNISQYSFNDNQVNVQVGVQF
jgi:hypothetical protein